MDGLGLGEVLGKELVGEWVGGGKANLLHVLEEFVPVPAFIAHCFEC